MKALLILLALSMAPQSPPISSAPVVFEFDGILDGDAIVSEYLGEMVIPPRPGPAGEWTALLISYACEYEAVSYVDNQTRDTIPASYWSSTNSSTLQFLFLQENPTTTNFTGAFPWYAVSAGTFLWPELGPGESYEGLNVSPSASYDHFGAYHAVNWPYVQPGAVVEVWARHGGIFTQWPDAGPHGTVWDTKARFSLRWGKLPQ